jgi:Nif-specific regulatory protein
MGPVPRPGWNEALERLLTLCQKMASERELMPLLDVIADATADLLDCERVAIFLVDREKKELWCKVASGNEDIVRLEVKGLVGRAVQTGETVNVADANSESQFLAGLDGQTGHRARNLLAVALRNQHREIIGAFEALDKRVGVFTARDEEALSALGGHAANAIETAQLIASLRRRKDELSEQNDRLMGELENRFTSHGIIGASPNVQAIVRLIEQIRGSSVNVLISGETGTGKELTAKAIHYTSPRARRPFVAVNCAAAPETLVESQLFGIEKGVATGENSRIGLFQQADGGTLFLDEIGDLSLTAQSKILRVLQERAVERVGGSRPVPVDVRLLAATNEDLEAEIANGHFREDLYYRIKVIHIHLPPLRDIREDIPLLANHFLREYCRETGRPPMQFAPEVLRKLLSSPWPGNVRQLRNEVMRLAACSAGSTIEEEDPCPGLPESGERVVAATPAPRPKLLKEAIEQIEREMIREALETTRKNQQQAARLLGLSRQGLINKMKRYGLGG